MNDKEKQNGLREAKKKWEKTALKEELETKGERKKEFKTWSGQVVERVYTPLDMDKRQWDYLEKLGFPGEYPFTRGTWATGGRGEEPPKFSYGGFGTAETTNKWLKLLMSEGGAEVTLALDLPTQVGLDSDHPLAKGEVGRVGVAIDSLADMEIIHAGIDLGQCRVGTVAPCMGPWYLALMLAVADKQGIPYDKLNITMQNEPLKDIVARGTYIFPPAAAMEFACDAVEYVAKNRLDGIGSIQYTGYHFREAGATIYSEVGFCVAIAIEFTKKFVERGIDVDSFPRIEFNFTAGVDLFEEVAKFRAFRRIWAKIMRDRFGAKTSKAQSIYIRAGSNSAVYTAQQPLNNIIRGTIAALVQVLGGVYYCKVAAYDEALSIPTPESSKLAIRTHQILAEESGILNTVDPLGGSYYVEVLTDQIEAKIWEVINEVEKMGGAIPAIEQGYMRNEIAKTGYEYQKEIETGERTWVGVNKYQDDSPLQINIMKVDPQEEEQQLANLRKLRKERDSRKVEIALDDLKQAAQQKKNIMVPLIQAAKAYATTGEVFDTLKSVWGTYADQRY